MGPLDILEREISPGNIIRHISLNSPVVVDWNIIRLVQADWEMADLFHVEREPLFQSILLSVDVLKCTEFKKVHNECWQASNGFWIWHNTEWDGVLPIGFYWGEGYHQVHTLHQLQNLCMLVGRFEIKIDLDFLKTLLSQSPV